MYTLESLKPLNASFDSEHRLEQSDVEMVNCFIELIESIRKEEPCLRDIIEHTDEYGNYCQNAHVEAIDDVTGRLSVRIVPHIPFVFRGDKEREVWFHNGGGMLTSVDTAALTYMSKREKLFMAFGHCGVAANGGVYFNALVNAWEYIAPNQKYPGYSTKDWAKQYISYIKNPVDGSAYRYYGQDVFFKNAAELQHWKDTYKAVEFAGEDPDHSVVFFYRERDRLISREEWDALKLPIDTRYGNGSDVIHVKVAYDDDAHIVTAYRFTNSCYLDSREFGPYERAKGTLLIAPGAE